MTSLDIKQKIEEIVAAFKSQGIDFRPKLVQCSVVNTPLTALYNEPEPVVTMKIESKIELASEVTTKLVVTNVSAPLTDEQIRNYPHHLLLIDPGFATGQNVWSFSNLRKELWPVALKKVINDPIFTVYGYKASTDESKRESMKVECYFPVYGSGLPFDSKYLPAINQLISDILPGADSRPPITLLIDDKAKYQPEAYFVYPVLTKDGTPMDIRNWFTGDTSIGAAHPAFLKRKDPENVDLRCYDGKFYQPVDPDWFAQNNNIVAYVTTSNQKILAMGCPLDMKIKEKSDEMDARDFEDSFMSILKNTLKEALGGSSGRRGITEVPETNREMVSLLWFTHVSSKSGLQVQIRRHKLNAVFEFGTDSDSQERWCQVTFVFRSQDEGRSEVEHMFKSKFSFTCSVSKWMELGVTENLVLKRLPDEVAGYLDAIRWIVDEESAHIGSNLWRLTVAGRQTCDASVDLVHQIARLVWSQTQPTGKSSIQYNVIGSKLSLCINGHLDLVNASNFEQYNQLMHSVYRYDFMHLLARLAEQDALEHQARQIKQRVSDRINALVNQMPTKQSGFFSSAL